MIDNYSLLEDYEWFGEFWLQDKKFTKNHFSGKLSYSPLNGISLNIILINNKVITLFKQNIPTKVIMYGVIKSKEGIQYVTLFDVSIGQRHDTLGKYGEISSVKLIPYMMVIGSDFIKNFTHIRMKTLYDREFNNFKSSTDLEPILKFELNDKIKLEIKPFIQSFSYKTNIKPIIRKHNESNKDEILSRIKIINDELRELSSIDLKVAEDQEDNFYTIFSNKNSTKCSIKNIHRFTNAIYKYRKMKSLLLGKYVYIEQMKIDFDKQNTNFIFIDRINYMYRNIEEKDKKNEKYPDIRLLNTELLNTKIMKKYSEIYDKNNLLIEFLMESLLNFTVLTNNQLKQRFVIAMALLEQNSTKIKEKEKYDATLKTYSFDDINNRFLHLLTNKDIDQKHNMKLTDILKNADNYQFGIILSALRNYIIHESKDISFGIKHLDTEKKRLYIKEYEKYWVHCLNTSNILYLIVNTINVLLYKILYTKIQVENIKQLEKKLYNRFLR